MYGKDTSNQGSPVILFSTLPALGDLCVLTVLVNSDAKSENSSFLPQVIRCREVIFTEPEVIASPVFNTDKTFYVVLTQSLCKTNRLQSRFRKIGLQTSEPCFVTPDIFQACLNYTMQARIAPKWNKAGQWLLQGRDFLTHSGYANAIKVELNVSNDELFFTLEGSTVRFPHLQLIDLDVLGTKLNEFKQNKSAIIKSQSIMQTWCHVLPSMKKGQIVSVSHTLPKDGPFKTYQDLKRHWKNSYGYRLPETEDGMIYYQVYFRPLGDRLFTYPEVCMRARDIQRLPRIDPKPVLTSFLQDLQTKMSNVCGTKLVLQSKARYQIIELNHLQQQEVTLAPNLSYRNPSTQRIIYRNSLPQSTNSNVCTNGKDFLLSKNSGSTIKVFSNNETTKTTINSQITTVRTPTAKVSTMEGPVNIPNEKIETVQDSEFDAEQGMARPNNEKSELKLKPQQFDVRITSSERDDDLNSVNVSSTTTAINHKIVPTFLVRKPKISMPQDNDKFELQKKIFPSFKPKKPVTRDTSSTLKTYGNVKNKTDTKEQAKAVSVPTQQTLSSKLSTKKNGYKGTKRRYLFNTGKGFEESQLSGTNQLSGTSYDGGISPVDNKTQLAKANIGFTKEMAQLQAANKNHLQFSSSLEVQRSQFHTAMLTSLHSSTTPLSNSNKRPAAQVVPENAIMKKSRSKPQIQIDVDIEQLAQNGQLNKVNSVTLIAWLRTRGVPCRSKDKKKDLEEKVIWALKMCVPET